MTNERELDLKTEAPAVGDRIVIEGVVTEVDERNAAISIGEGDRPEKYTLPLNCITRAIRALVRAEHYHAGSIVSMPVMYPSGASVVLELFAQGERVIVSDRRRTRHSSGGDELDHRIVQH